MLCAVSIIPVCGHGFADEPIATSGLRQPKSVGQASAADSTRLSPRISDCLQLIDTEMGADRPVVAGFEQAVPDARPVGLQDGHGVPAAGDGPESSHIEQGQPLDPEVPFTRPGEAGWGEHGMGSRHKPRHKGFGQPLLRSSWLFRPLSFSTFAGMMQGSPLIDDWLGQEAGYFGGYRFGWDFDYYWGVEFRYGFGTLPLYDTQRAKDAAAQAFGSVGRDYAHDCEIVLGDIDLLYYPWGDATWRPYLMVGLGTSWLRFEDRLGTSFKRNVFAMPLAIGVKYRCNSRLVLRFDLADNMIFGDGHGFDMVNNMSLNGGVEIRFGGKRTAYWPWNPERHHW